MLQLADLVMVGQVGRAQPAALLLQLIQLVLHVVPLLLCHTHTHLLSLHFTKKHVDARCMSSLAMPHTPAVTSLDKSPCKWCSSSSLCSMWSLSCYATHICCHFTSQTTMLLLRLVPLVLHVVHATHTCCRFTSQTTMLLLRLVPLVLHVVYATHTHLLSLHFTNKHVNAVDHPACVLCGPCPAMPHTPAVRKAKKGKDYAFWFQLNEKPSITPGCPGTPAVTSVHNQSCQCWCSSS